jgi:hypothetical protein
MKNKILEKLLSLTVLVAFFSFSSAQAAVTNPGFDYLIKGGGQTYPLGGIITAQAGYGVKLWEGLAPEEGPAVEVWLSSPSDRTSNRGHRQSSICGT